MMLSLSIEERTQRDTNKNHVNTELDIGVMLSYAKEWHHFPGASVAKNPPANTGQMGQSLGREDLLEKEMATHTSILAWKIPWTEEPGRLQFMGLQRVGHDWAT